MLLEEFLKPMGISQYRLAKEIAVSQRRVSEIVHGRRSVTADTDLRLCRFFGLSDHGKNICMMFPGIIGNIALVIGALKLKAKMNGKYFSNSNLAIQI